ncbi:MAG: hypothetical protein ACRDXX_16750 [Stackebrandtia sp.]
MSHTFTVEVAPLSGQSLVQLDRRCRRLAEELRVAPGLRAAPVAATPPGDKSGLAQEIGVLLVSGLFSAAAVKAAADVIVAFVHRGSAASVTVRRGDREIIVDGGSVADVAAEVKRLEHLLSDDAGEAE